MADKGQLWDDSALIKAFDNAIYKYKTMHGLGENFIGGNTEEDLPADDGSDEFCSTIEHVKNEDNTIGTLEAKTEMGKNLLQIQENSPVELNSSPIPASSSNILNHNLPATNENPAAKSSYHGEFMVSSDAKSVQDEGAWRLKSPEEYSKLLNKYYELEDQRQKILEQLNQFGSWSNQNPVSCTFTSEEHQSHVAQPLYDTVTCYCPYGCQNWAWNSVPDSCPGGACVDKNCNATSRGVQNVKLASQENPDFVQTAMVAAERALSSLTKEASINTDIFANEEKNTEVGVQVGQLTEITNSSTDLSVVLNAWYSAGFYTGKYLSEQSMEKRKQCQGI